MRNKACFIALIVLVDASASAQAQQRIYAKSQIAAANRFQPPSTAELARGLKPGANAATADPSLAMSRMGYSIPRLSLSCPMPVLPADSSRLERMPNMSRDAQSRLSEHAARSLCSNPLRR